MATSSDLIIYRIVFTFLGLFMLASLIYTIVTDGSPFRLELLTPWLTATLIDFYVNVVVISVWVAYKESSWISAAIWVVFLICFGSITTCAYIVKNLCNISSQAIHGQDSLHVVLYRKESKWKMKLCSLSFLRVLFSSLAIFMLAAVIYTVVTDGLPFRKELLTPWMAATLIDFYINITAISVWVAHRETTWLSTFIWIILFICLGSIATCTYVAVQLFQLSDKDPMYHVLLDCNDKNTDNIQSK